MPTNPQSEQELLARADAMAGFSLAQLATDAGIAVPRDLRRDKGWVGHQDDPHRSLWQAAGNHLRLRSTTDRRQRSALGRVECA